MLPLKNRDVTQEAFAKNGESGLATCTNHLFLQTKKKRFFATTRVVAFFRGSSGNMTACFETFNKDGFCSFPQRHCDGTKEASDSRRDMLGHQNEHFVRNFLTFHTLQLQNRRFPTSFLTNRPQNRRFVRGFRRFS